MLRTRLEKAQEAVATALKVTQQEEGLAEASVVEVEPPFGLREELEALRNNKLCVMVPRPGSVLMSDLIAEAQMRIVSVCLKVGVDRQCRDQSREHVRCFAVRR